MESVRVPKNPKDKEWNPCEYRRTLRIWNRIRGCTGKRENSCEYPKIVPTSTGKGSNLCEYRKMIESGRVKGKGRIRACECEKTFPYSTEKGSTLLEYRKMEESGRVPGKGRIRASIEKLSGPVPKTPLDFERSRRAK